MRGTTVDPCEIAAVASGLAAVDEFVLERDGVLARLREARRLRGFADTCEAALARRLDVLSAAEPSIGGNTSSAAGEAAESDRLFGSDHSGPRESERDRQRTRRRAAILERCPGFKAALEAGWITSRHVDVLATAIAGIEPAVAVELLADEDALVEFARRATPDTFAACLRQRVDLIRADGGMPRLERQRRDSRAHCTPDPDTGMYRLVCDIDPERGTAIAQAIQARIDRLYQTAGATDGLTPQQVRAQAIFELITRSGDGDGCGFEALVIVDHQSLTSGPHAATVCETAEGIRLPVSHVQDLCATATVTAAILDSDGTTLAVGRCERIANRAQRRALRAMYRTCVYPGCDVTFDRCHIHHIQWWDHGGSTDLDNLVPVCHRHHHLIHDEHWTLTIDQHRTLRWYRPDGTLHHETPFQPLTRCTHTTNPDTTDHAPPSDRHEAPPHGPAPPGPAGR